MGGMSRSNFSAIDQSELEWDGENSEMTCQKNEEQTNKQTPSDGHVHGARKQVAARNYVADYHQSLQRLEQHERVAGQEEVVQKHRHRLADCLHVI